MIPENYKLTFAGVPMDIYADYQPEDEFNFEGFTFAKIMVGGYDVACLLDETTVDAIEQRLLEMRAQAINDAKTEAVMDRKFFKKRIAA